MAGEAAPFTPDPPDRFSVFQTSPRVDWAAYPQDMAVQPLGILEQVARTVHDGGGAVLPELSWSAVLTAWTFAWIPAVVTLLSAAAYLWGVHRLTARGDRWSLWRTLPFLGGLGTVLIATQSVLATYDTTLLWIHMIQHMLLAMVAPVFLALGAPITLALRTLPPGPRKALLAVLHSWPAKVLTFPVVVGVLFVANPFVLYFTPWYEATLRNPWLHEFNHMHFLVLGCLWYWPLLGLDPMPNRLSYGFRMLAAFLVLPFHAWLGVSIMSASTVIAEDWYFGLARPWGPTPIEDQQIAGGLLWASGDLVALLVVIIIFVQWMHDSEREARREDRRLDALEAAAHREAPLPAEPGL